MDLLIRCWLIAHLIMAKKAKKQYNQAKNICSVRLFANLLNNLITTFFNRLTEL